ncbi:MAG: apolipoprotein N-acyltransferase [Bryobacteraceae bacterium]
MNIALSILSALLMALVFPSALSDHGWWPLAFVALTPLIVVAFREARALRRFLLGWLCGFVYWAVVCLWIQFVLEVHGGMGPYLSWFAFVLFALYKGLHLAVFTWSAGWLAARPRLWTALAIALLFTAIEQTHGFFGFAWLTPGNAAIDTPLLGRIAPLAGVFGITFLFALVAAGIASAVARRSWQFALPAVLGIGVLLIPAIPKPDPPDRNAVLLQPNIAEERSWSDADWRETSEQLIRLSREAAASHTDLIAWPEMPAPVYYFEDRQFADQIGALARETGASVLLGTVGRAPSGAPLNSAAFVSPQGQLGGQYSKINLVPFGEFVPPLFSWVNKITKEAGDYAPGTKQTVFGAGGETLSTFICYESAFPDFVRVFVQDGAQLLVNISNDGYFGRSAAREQHLSLVRMRALENQRWILRPANNGITVAIDPSGRVTDRFPPYQQTAGRVAFRYVSTLTPYSRWGSWFAWLWAIAAILTLIPYLQRRRPAS